MFQQHRGFGGGVEAATQSLKALGNYRRVALIILANESSP